MVDIGVWVLRLGIGIMFTAHGLQKAFGMFGGPGILGFRGFLNTLGMHPAFFWAYLAAYTELVGGICLILGMFTRVSAALLLIVIVVAGVKVHFAKGFFLSAGGFEYTFVIACACLALLLTGGGKLSIIKKL